MLSPTTLRWLSLISVIWLQSISGTNLDFSAYSSQLKNLLSISQIQLNNLAFASDAGKLLGWFSGVGLLYLPQWLVLMIGASLGLVGYGVQFLFLTNMMSSLPYWAIFLLSALAGNSICWINTVCYAVTIQNFASSRQIAVGVSTSYAGLSANIYTALVDVIWRSDTIAKAKSYLLLNSMVPMLVSVLISPLVKRINCGEFIQLESGLAVMLVITVATGVYSVFGSVNPASSRYTYVFQAVGLSLFLAAPLAVPLAIAVQERFEKRWPMKKKSRVCDLITSTGEVGGEEGVKSMKVELECLEGGKVVESDDQEIGKGFLLKKLDFWLYFFVYMSGATLGLVFLNNLGQIAESRGLSKSSSLVSLSSSFGFFGRLIPSLLDYFFTKNKYMLTRPAFIGTLMVPMAASFFLLLNTSRLFLYISTAAVGICTGAITSLAVATTSDLFGDKNFGINHNIVVINIPIGSFVFGYLAGLLYQRAADGGGGTCMGSKCYNATFLIWGTVCSMGTLLSFVLYLRTRRLYLEAQQKS